MKIVHAHTSSWMLGSAPFDTSTWTTLRCPSQLARARAVLPSCSMKMSCKSLHIFTKCMLPISIFYSLVPRRWEGGGEKGVPGAYCMCMHVNFQKFLENRITSRHRRYTAFCEVADFYCVEDAYHSHALCEWWRRSDASTQLFGCKNDPRVCPF